MYITYLLSPSIVTLYYSNNLKLMQLRIVFVCLLVRTPLCFLRFQREIHISTSLEKLRQEKGEIRGQLSSLRKYLRDAIIESFPRHAGADARGGLLFPTRLVAT